METTQATERSVPWSSREAWWGAIALILWIAGVYAMSYLIQRNAITVDPGLFTAITEAGLLVPVWWLVIRRYGVGWNVLGLRLFDAGTLGVGCGLMIMSLLFNAAWASFLAIFDLRAQIEHIHVIQMGHGEDEVEGLAGEHLHGPGGGAGLGDARRTAEVQSPVLVDDLGGQAAVLFEDIGVVRAGHEKDLEHLV